MNMKSIIMNKITLLVLFISMPSLYSIPTNNKKELSYTTYCNSITPQSTKEILNFSILPQYPSSHISGGAPFLDRNTTKTLLFRRLKAFQTDVDGVFKLEVTLILRQNRNRFSFYAYGNYTSEEELSRSRGFSRRFSVLRFGFSGFWSEVTGEVCMVGFGTSLSKHGDDLIDDITAVFKLYNVRKSSSIATSLISGSLESLSSASDSGYFEPIMVLMFSEMSYEYSMVLNEIRDGGFNRFDDVQKSLPISSQPRGHLCSIFNSYNQFELGYSSTCVSAKNCTPFGTSIGYLPRELAFNFMQCDNDDQKLRLFVKFSDNSYDNVYYTSFDPTKTLIGEGIWDGKKNQLRIVACRILNVRGSLKNAHLENCSIRLTLRYHATRSIKISSSMSGHIWSSKSTNDSEYFETIVFKNTQNQGLGIEGLKYEYTQIDRVKTLCTPTKETNGKKGDYPDGDAYVMTFDMYVKTFDGNTSFGYSTPLYVGDHIYERNGFDMYATMAPSSSTIPMALSYVMKYNSTLQVPVNMSYWIFFPEPSNERFDGLNSTYNVSSSQAKAIGISAEGIYDPKTGGLCMIGCKNVDAESQLIAENDLDCEILIKFQFPSKNLKNNGGFIKGSIESMRKTNDSLYFGRLELTSSAYTISIASETVWRMDFEIILVLISNTLACIFVAIQLFYVKKHPQTLPFASLIMLAILSLSYMMPLLLNFEALFLPNHGRQNVSLENGNWIEVNEVLVRVVTMVAFLLQFRLLQLTWSSRVSGKMSIWAPEKKVLLYVLLPLYIVGALITCALNWQKNDPQHILGDLKSYAGLILDGFLLPQILLNIFSNTKEKTLSLLYYIGTTFVRLLPHSYDLYRENSDQNAGRFERSYIYANHGVDFYSVAWDVTIPCVALGFASIIFLQQKFGGRCVLPRRFREGEGYEKVPVITCDL